jgi:hypothetical protein
MPRKIEYTVLDMIDSAMRQVKATPLNLGGVAGIDGGPGGPPGGFIGRLPQKRVTYDTTEAATLATVGSGTLLDNLNHIRYWIRTLESGGALTVMDYDGNPSVHPVDTIRFSGAVVTDLGNGDVLVVVSGGAGASLTVQEIDGSPIVTNVDKIIFSGASVTDLGDGDVLVAISGGSGTPFSGTANRVVGTDGSGALYTIVWLGIDETNDAIEWGANVGGKETNAGKIWYDVPSQKLFIVGAGTTAGSRVVRIYDLAESDNFKIANNLNSQVLGTDSTGIIIDNTINVLTSLWIPRSETWTRTGNHTFTISGDVTTIFRKGCKVRYNDGGSTEYGVVYSASHAAGTTTITLITNTDFAMAAATITDKNISYSENPEGFPDEFAFTPTGLVTIADGSQGAWWKTIANKIFIHGNVTYGSSTTFSSSDLTLPVAILATFDTAGNQGTLGVANYLDSGNNSYLGNIRFQTTTTARFQATRADATWVSTAAISSTVPFTWGNADEIGFFIEYLF